MSSDHARPAELFQLDRSTCVALLGVHHVGRLIVPGDDPYVVPLNYHAQEGMITFRTERRPVIEGIVGRRVVFEVDMFDDRSKSGWSVVVRGHAQEAPDSAAHPWAPGERDCVISVTADEVTGRLLRGAVALPAMDGRGYV